MSSDEFEVRPGRIRARGAGGPKTFVGVALASAARAGGLARRSGARGGTFGAGRRFALQAQQGLGPRARRVVIKARVVRHRARAAPLGLHLDYLQRDGVTRDGDAGQMFDAASDRADADAFATRAEDDRHHFRFIVAPEDAEQLSDLKAFARDLMRQAETDLGTGLDWVAVDHWNTGQPHLHILVRGRRDTGEDLVISRDYIAEGLRARARALATLELGPRTEQDIARVLDREVVAERWTSLDRELAGRADAEGRIDLRPERGRASGVRDLARVARARRLQTLGLAQETGSGRWRLAPDAEPVLRELGRRGDVIARLHRAFADPGIERDPAQFSLEPAEEGLVGKLVGRGLDDELRGSGYAVIDGLDGRAHHVALAELEDASDARVGAVVRLRRLNWPDGRSKLVLDVRSDLGLAEQVQARGATWLDRQLIGRAPDPLGDGGWAAEVRAALDERVETLIACGYAERTGGGIRFARDLLQTLRSGDLTRAAAQLAAETGLEARPLDGEGTLRGTYRRRLDLASGRFAMIDDGLGFSLAPWRPDLERHLGREVEGQLSRGTVVWTLGRKRGLGR
jgi:type IV secretory pathway VirD2 relaxase